MTITNIADYEVSMGVLFLGSDGSNFSGTDPIRYDWIKPELSTTLTSLGVIDLSPESAPFLLNPNSFGYGSINFYLHAITPITTGAVADVSYVLLVPDSDDNALMHAAWSFDSAAGREVYCNYDPNNQYIAEVDANHFDSGYNGNSSIVGLDYLMTGNIITLIPNVDNTIVFYPVYQTQGNWRQSIVNTAGHTQETSLAIRPRYLYGG